MLKEHEYRDLINKLTNIAIAYRDGEQLRKQIAREIRPFMAITEEVKCSIDRYPCKTGVTCPECQDRPVMRRI